MRHFDATLIQQGYSPSAVHEVPAADLPAGVDELTYIGYFANGDPEKAVIQEIAKSANITTFRYPFGQFDFKFDWNERTAYVYDYRKFY